MEYKTCSKCGRKLPVTSFNWRNKAEGDRQDTCRECFSRYNHERYLRKRAEIKDAVRKYMAENSETVLKTRLATNARHPTKVNARKCVEAAINAGVLKRPDHCSGCGCSNSEHRIEAHHNDYSKPLDVIWLCTPCHREMDARRRRQEKSSELQKR